MQGLYQRVRAENHPERAHALWRSGRDELFTAHPQSPLAATDDLRQNGVPYWSYNPNLRWTLEVEAPESPLSRRVSTGATEITNMSQLGWITLPAPFDARLAVWWLEQYGGGLFLPVKDATAGNATYGGGRYLLDTAKGADLGGNHSALVIDLNFLFHLSCRYDMQWICPLAPQENIISASIEAGERLTHA